jgi:hypothetical protein
MSNPDRNERTPATPHIPTLNRREWLLRGGGGFGALGLLGLLADDRARAASPGDPDASAWRRPPRAKSVIFLFMEGGPSHIDMFDPKPKLDELAGQRLPSSFKPVITPMGESDSPLLASKRKWKQHGQGGLWFSDWLPHMAECADDLTVIRSCWGNGLNHVGGVCQMNTGSILAGRPCLGSWVSYGLGTENQNLPGFVVLLDNEGGVVAGGPRNWGPGFMPAMHQGTRLRGGAEPIPNLANPSGIDADRQRAKLDYLGLINRRHAELRPEQTELDARIKSYELAFRMQAEAPEAVDLAGESEETRALYGMDSKETAAFGRNCLLARRLLERGVRFVQLYNGGAFGSPRINWDAHEDLAENHGQQAAIMDRPVAGLLKDLKARGMLDDTLVVWTTEFGRTPFTQGIGGKGRDHHQLAFTCWMAGGGLKPGYAHGASDEVGYDVGEDPVTLYDFHATILHLLGLDHKRLTFYHNGIRRRLTDVHGEVVQAVLA